jgi:hypothetical protein
MKEMLLKLRRSVRCVQRFARGATINSGGNCPASLLLRVVCVQQGPGDADGQDNVLPYCLQGQGLVRIAM